MTEKRALWDLDGSVEKPDSVEETNVFQEELEHILARRSKDGYAEKKTANSPVQDLVGLAFSGGGIRSATFGLGVLEALKEQNLLKKIDYLSTVSGGGYIGAWLSANCKRAVECDIRVHLVESDDDKKQLINQFETEIKPKNGCGLRIALAKNHSERQNILVNYQTEFEARKNESKILIVHSVESSNTWVVAGFSDSGIFNSFIVDNAKSHLYSELKKETIDKSKITELAAEILERSFKKNAYALLIIAVKTNTPLKWTVAGFNEESEFIAVDIDDSNDKLSLELKRAQSHNTSIIPFRFDLNKEGVNKYRIIELAASYINPDKPSSWLNKDTVWKKSIDHLRRNSNYLSPKLGFFSADIWTVATTWLRNTLLVQLLLVLATVSMLILPRILFILFDTFYTSLQYNDIISAGWHGVTVAIYLLVVVSISSNLLRLNRPESKFLSITDWKMNILYSTVLLLIAWRLAEVNPFNSIAPDADIKLHFLVKLAIAFLLIQASVFILLVLAKLKNLKRPKDKLIKQINYTQKDVQRYVIIPLLLYSLLFSVVLQQFVMQHYSDLNSRSFSEVFCYSFTNWPVSIFVIFTSLWLISVRSVREYNSIKKPDRIRHLKYKVLINHFLAPLVSAIVLQALLSGIIFFLLQNDFATDHEQWISFVWTAPLLLYAFSLVGVVLIGVIGREATEAVREWFSRYGAWLAIYGFCWMMLVIISIYGPLLSAIILKLGAGWSSSISLAWVATTLAGILASKSRSNNGSSTQNSSAHLIEIIAKVAPFIFIIGLLFLLSTALHYVIAYVTIEGITLSPNYFLEHHWIILSKIKFIPIFSILLFCLCCVYLLGYRVDINEFSLNTFYRIRLIRCYLGATRFRKNERHPQYFTGFDEKDDIKMADLIDANKIQAPTGPFHIINCALNLGGSRDLSLHTRHSAIYTLTPLRCGSSYKSKDHLGDRGGEETEIGYIATSSYGGIENQPTLGQAVSISGAAASPNMGYHTSPVMAFLMTVFNARLGWWFPNPVESPTKQPSPNFSLFYLLRELFGAADETSEFLAISDGGHFENLAAYELVKRKCEVIIISDGECDPNLQFEGLGRLIRMCQVDLGAKISIDISSIQENKNSGWSKNRCAVGDIEYSDTTAPKGIKKGKLIYLKASMNGYEDTAIQQYKATHPTFPHETTGDQFYGEDQFESYRQLGYDIANKVFTQVANEDSFSSKIEKLTDIYSPVLPDSAKFSEHAGRLMDLWSDLSNNKNLSVIDKEINSLWPDKPENNFRSIYYICSEMIQLMENVYLDLNLEDTWDHPDTKGWRTLFNHWKQSKSIQNTWNLSKKTYGSRFQFFWEHKLINTKDL